MAADPSAIIDSVKGLIETLDKVVPEIYHFLADPTKQSIDTYDSGVLIDEEKLKELAIANVAKAVGQGADEVKDHVTVDVEDGDTVTTDYSLNRKSNIKDPVHGTTTGYAVKIPMQFNVTPVRWSVTYNEPGGDAITSPVAHAIKKIEIGPGPGEIYLWMLRSAKLEMTPHDITSGGEHSYKFDVKLSDLVGYLRPDMNGSSDQVTVGPDGSLSGATERLEAP